MPIARPVSPPGPAPGVAELVLVFGTSAESCDDGPGAAVVDGLDRGVEPGYEETAVTCSESPVPSVESRESIAMAPLAAASPVFPLTSGLSPTVTIAPSE